MTRTPCLAITGRSAASVIKWVPCGLIALTEETLRSSLMSLISPTLLSFCAAVVVLAVVQTWWRRRRLLPGLAVPPAASWIWGHERGIFEAETGAKYTAWANELGPTYQIKSAWLVGPVLLFGLDAATPNLCATHSTRTLWLQQTQERSTIFSQRMHTTTTIHLCFDH